MFVIYFFDCKKTEYLFNSAPKEALEAGKFMEIRNLMTFIHVAELNSFTKASRALDYSQSTISFQIKQLEDELGYLLFERINHTISLSEKGRELLE